MRKFNCFLLCIFLVSCSIEDDSPDSPDSPVERIYTESDVLAACDAVVYTYNPERVASSISQVFPISTEEAKPLGEKAVKGYGICACVVSHAFDIEIDISIGYCKGEKYIECQKAYCGRDLDLTNNST